MSLIRRKSKPFLKFLCCLFGVILISFFYCEVLHYYIVISQCKWPPLHANEVNSDTEVLRVMAVADTHLLGRRNGHWFDKLRREWQMYRAFQSSITLHSPEVVLFLGDLFDEGKWCTKEEFDNYVGRFNSLFHVSPSIEVLIAAGNHDMGFHYNLNPYLSNRFEEAMKAPAVQVKTLRGVVFVAINSMAMHGDDCFLCKPARQKVEGIARELRCIQQGKQDCQNKFLSESPQYSQPVLIQHYPLYRESDAVCNEPDSAPEHLKGLKFRERWECLSEESTDMLLTELEPRLVLSGHTHHGCRVVHNYTRRGVKGTKLSVVEHTVASLSWRNKINPSLLMISISKNDFSIYNCHLPNENSVVLFYFAFGISFFIILLRRKLKLGNFIYFKLKSKV